MRTGGVEPPRAEAHTGLSRACLPIPITSAWWYGQESNPRLPGFNRALVPSQLPHRCIGTRRRRTDSNRRETGLQSAASPLGHDAAISSKVPGEGVEPKCHFLVQSQASYRLDDPGSHVRADHLCVAPVPSQSSVSVSGGCLPTGSRVPNQRSIERRPPHALRHLCESSPAAPGFSRSAPRGLEPLLHCSRPGRASTCCPPKHEGRPVRSPSSQVWCGWPG
jgi:hypothetical protein